MELVTCTCPGILRTVNLGSGIGIATSRWINVYSYPFYIEVRKLHVIVLKVKVEQHLINLTHNLHAPYILGLVVSFAISSHGLLWEQPWQRLHCHAVLGLTISYMQFLLMVGAIEYLLHCNGYKLFSEHFWSRIVKSTAIIKKSTLWFSSIRPAKFSCWRHILTLFVPPGEYHIDIITFVNNLSDVITFWFEKILLLTVLHSSNSVLHLWISTFAFLYLLSFRLWSRTQGEHWPTGIAIIDDIHNQNFTAR